MLTVRKFGGSSLADMDKIQKAADNCARALSRGQELVIVVSAAGDSTDILSSEAELISPEPDKREQDALMATGEQRSAALMALMLQSMGIKARSFTGRQAGIITCGPHGGAEIAMIIPDRIKNALRQGIVPVVAGFQGVDLNGDISTLGRGGSDTTAVALAAALKARCCEIYTDVDGIYTADPRLVEEARFLKEIDYRDMLALSLAGSQVLHFDSVQLAMAGAVDVRLMSAFGSSPGTRLAYTGPRRPPFAGVTRNTEKSTVSLVGQAADAAVLSDLSRFLEKGGIAAVSGAAGRDCVYVKVAPEQLLPALSLAHSFFLSR